MNQLKFLLAVILMANIATSQKLKGSKVVTVEPREIENFENIEISNNIELFLSKSDKASLEIEADDNLHEVINISQNGTTLIIYATQEVSSFKKLSVKIFFTDDFKLLTARGNSNITALTDLELPNLTIKLEDNSRLFATVKTDNFILNANDKSKSEFNVTAKDSKIELNKNATLKALISSQTLQADFYQKTNATIEGDAIDLKLRLDNNSVFTGKNLSTKTADILIEGSARCSIEVNEKAVISASGKAEIDLHGEQKIEINKFSDNATISKRNNRIK